MVVVNPARVGRCPVFKILRLDLSLTDPACFFVSIFFGELRAQWITYSAGAVALAGEGVGVTFSYGRGTFAFADAFPRIQKESPG